MNSEDDIKEYKNVCSNCQLEWTSYGLADFKCPGCGCVFIGH